MQTGLPLHFRETTQTEMNGERPLSHVERQLTDAISVIEVGTGAGDQETLADRAAEAYRILSALIVQVEGDNQHWIRFALGYLDDTLSVGQKLNTKKLSLQNAKRGIQRIVFPAPHLIQGGWDAGAYFF